MNPRTLNNASPKDLFEEAIAECTDSQDYTQDGTQTQTQTDFMTQNELTQMGDMDGDDALFSPPTQPPSDPRQVSWGRLIAEEGEGRYEMIPRDPSGARKEGDGDGGGTTFLGCLEGILPSDKFNEYTLGRNSKMDIVVGKPSKKSGDPDSKIHEWAHSMVSNRHCIVYCMLKPNGGMDIFCEDTSGNGTIINGTILLKRGEKRMLHTGDEICLVNPHPLRKKIRNPDKILEVQRRYTYIFVNVYQQQQANFLSSGKRKRVPPTSGKRRGIVDVRAIVNHSMEHHHHHRSPRSSTSKLMQPATTAKVDKRVEELYDIRDTLGTGTCGEVKRAISRQTGKEFAVKIILLTGRNRGSKLSEKESEALKAEASILQALDHPYVVQLHDVFVNPGVAIYLVMELMSGGDLFDRIIQKGRYTEVESRRTMRRLLNAVFYLHELKSVVHRDLKPENILCVGKSSDVEVKLTDFGLAKSVTQEGLKTFCGTPQYFAPEVLRRNYTIAGKGRYGKEADMWSLGVILYVLLSGTPPFDVSQGFDAVADGKINFPESFFEGVSSLARDLVKKLLVTNPSKRLSVKDACEHPWILMNDGDTHTNPLDDPNAPLRQEVDNETPTKRLFDTGITAAAAADTDHPKQSTPLSTDVKSVVAAAVTSPKKENVLVSSQVTPSENDASATTPEPVPLPKDLNSRSNHFRDIVARSAEKESQGSPGRQESPVQVVQKNDSEETELVFAIPPMTSPGTDNPKPTELTEDEICSTFSDESRSSFSIGTVCTKINNDKALDRSSLSSSSDNDKENAEMARDTTLRCTKRKMVEENDTTAKTPKRGKKTTSKKTPSPPGTDSKQTTLSNFFQKKETTAGSL